MKRVHSNDVNVVTEDAESRSSPYDWKIEIDMTGVERLGCCASVTSGLDDESLMSTYRKGKNISSRRKKKPKGMPKRPLSAYNVFFSKERAKIVEENSKEREKLTFEELGKIIGRRWKALGEVERKRYDQLAEVDSIRYRKEMDAYNEAKRLKRSEREPVVTSVCTKGPPLTPPLRGEKSEAPPPLSIFPLAPSTPVKARLPGTPPDESSSQKNQDQTRFANTFAVSTQVVALSKEPLSPWRQPPFRDFPEHTASPAMAFAAATAPPSPTPVTIATRSHAAAPVTAELQQKNNYLPVPPGMELFLPDSSGQDRKYVVNYNFYRMTRREAEEYMRSLESAARSPVPASATASGPSTQIYQQQLTTSTPPHSPVLQILAQPVPGTYHGPVAFWKPG